MAAPLPAHRRFKIAFLPVYRSRQNSHLPRRDAARTFARMLRVLRPEYCSASASCRFACRPNRSLEIVLPLVFSAKTGRSTTARGHRASSVGQPAHGRSAGDGLARFRRSGPRKQLVHRHRARPPVVSPTAAPSVFPFATCVPLRPPPFGSPLQGRGAPWRCPPSRVRAG